MTLKQDAFVHKHHPRAHRKSVLSNGRLMIQKGREFTKKADQIHSAMQSEANNNMMKKYKFYHQNGAAMMKHGRNMMTRAQQQSGMNPYRVQKWVHILMQMRQWE